MNVLMLDNYDSFTYNIVQYLGELGADVTVVRNDEMPLADLVALVAAQGIERIYRAMMECYIAYEHDELARLRAAGLSPKKEESV